MAEPYIELEGSFFEGKWNAGVALGIVPVVMLGCEAGM